jgi:hypothetical protein
VSSRNVSLNEVGYFNAFSMRGKRVPTCTEIIISEGCMFHISADLESRNNFPVKISKGSIQVLIRSQFYRCFLAFA